MLPPKVGGRGREHRLDYPRGDDNKGYDRVWRSNEKDFINNYEPPGEGFKDWLLFMCINTKDSLGKFSLSLYGESARELKVDPQQILGKEVPMLKDCFFTSRINPLDIRMIPYRWYTEWFNLLDEILSGNMALFNREGAATLNEDVVKLVFSNPDYAICIRYEITFEDNNQAVLKARALNMPLQQIAGTSFERGNVATVAIQSFPLMTLGMDPPINQLGFEFPIYPVLLAPHELTMNSYESYCLEALPAILQTVHDHLDLTPQQMAKQIKTKSALKNEYRFKNMVNHKKRARDNDEFLDPLKVGWNRETMDAESAEKVKSHAQQLMRDEAAHSTKAPAKADSGFPNIMDTLNINKESKDDDVSSVLSGPTFPDRGKENQEQGLIRQINNASQRGEESRPQTKERPVISLAFDDHTDKENRDANSHRQGPTISLSPAQQWEEIVINHGITDSSSLAQVFKTGIPKDTVKAIFPYAAQQGVFEDISSFTMPISQLRLLNNNAKKEFDPTIAHTKRDIKQLAVNNKNILVPRKFEGTDDMLDKIHPRLFYNAPLTESGKLFQMMARNKHMKPVTTDQYNLNHMNGAGCITTKGWFDAHDLESHSVTSKNYCHKNFNKGMSGNRRFIFGQEDHDGTIETEISLDECEDVSEAMECLVMIAAARRRANILDYSLEPLQRYLARNTWFMSHPDRPSNVSAGRFAAGFIDHVLKNNAARFQSVQPHLNYNQMDDIMKEFKMTCKFNNRPFGQGSRNNKDQGNKNSGNKDANNSNKPPCHYFNQPAGCKFKKKCRTGPHLCSVQIGANKTCQKEHPAHLHDAKFSAKPEKN